jgi:phage gpG-like protein
MKKFNFDRIVKNVQKLKRSLPIELANETKNYFMTAFKTESWDGHSWIEPKRKRKKGTSSRLRSATLVQSGKLRRAVSNSLKEKTFEKIRFEVTDVDYAEIHNEGGTINKKGSEKVLHFKAKGANIATRQMYGTFAKKGKSDYAQKVKIGAHDIYIPQRQYMGQTKELTKIQEKVIEKQMAKVWQG